MHNKIIYYSYCLLTQAHIFLMGSIDYCVMAQLKN